MLANIPLNSWPCTFLGHLHAGKGAFVQGMFFHYFSHAHGRVHHLFFNYLLREEEGGEGDGGELEGSRIFGLLIPLHCLKL